MDEKPDFSQFLQANGKCCICEKPLKDSKKINLGMLDKFITWDHPGWGNILAIDEIDRLRNRALAVICDSCYDANIRKEPVGEIRFALEVSDTLKEIFYHPVEELDDAPQIRIPEEFR